MTTTTLTEKAIAVTGLPEGAKCTIANNLINDGCITLIVKDKHGNNTWHKLPEGNWTILGRSAELTKDDWKQVVERHDLYEGSLYYNYTGDIFFTSALESGHSLLKAKGLHVTNPYTNVECPNQWCENGYIDQGYNEKWRCDYCQQNEESEEEAELLTNPLILIQ